MCGIAGIVGNFDAEVLKKLSNALSHRGPDGQGSYTNGSCALVHTRLAIIDVDGGNQPFVTHREDGSKVALIANGEIYNNPELRSSMKDVEFQSQSDCEPPLHLYLKHGLDFVDHLRGMYAIAIWDERQQRLVLARDPFGIKPLYFAPILTGYAFASEPAALVRAGVVKAELNTDKRDELLQLQFSTGTDGALAGIHRVQPGETIVIKGHHIVERRVRPALPGGGVRKISSHSALLKLDTVMNDAIGVHQRSDVPYGMFFSGGIDSSILLAMMNRLNKDPVVAFTAGFASTNVPDERALAQKLATQMGAHHIEVEFGADDFWQTLPMIVNHMDDPVADYAILPTWKLAEKARSEGIKVILSGEGGDELFAGYGRYRSANRWLLPRDMYRKGIMDGLDILQEEDPSRPWRSDIAQAGINAQGNGRTKLQTLQAQDIKTWLSCDLMTKLDRMLMAHGVEGRVPFLDQRMADFAFTLPDGLKIKRKLGKRLLRHWLDGVLPDAKPFSKKRGFSVPVGEWIIQNGDVSGQLVASQNCIKDICNPSAVRDVFRSAHAKAGKAAWTLLFYALWHKIHIEGSAVDGNVCDVLSS